MWQMIEDGFKEVKLTPKSEFVELNVCDAVEVTDIDLQEEGSLDSEYIQSSSNSFAHCKKKVKNKFYFERWKIEKKKNPYTALIKTSEDEAELEIWIKIRGFCHDPGEEKPYLWVKAFVPKNRFEELFITS